MKKNRPDWQKGKLNGIGGHIDEGESNIECIVREAEEETGLTTSPSDWKHAATLGGPDWNMDVFSLVCRGNEADVKTCTDEKVSWYDIECLPSNVITNVRWLVPLALDKLQDNQLGTVVVRYQ